MPLGKLSPKVALFFTTSISLAVQEYSYNLGLTKGRLQNITFLLPLNKDKSINTDLIEEIMQSIDNIECLDYMLDIRY